MSENYLSKILTARVYDVAEETPLDFAPALSARLGNDVWIKREDAQSIFSFKIRGAYNKMAQMPRNKLARGVIASSAGNHAQGVALAAAKLGCKATIVMPTPTPEIKVRAVRKLGARIVLEGDTYSDAFDHALAMAKTEKLEFIPPYDDPAIIAGQGTIGFEILKQFRTDLDAIFVPVGGGGLIAGVACYVKQINPKIKIIGVEPDDSDSLYQALKAGRRVKLKDVGQFADGVAVKQVGKENFRLAKMYVDDVIQISTDQMCAAIKDVFEDTRTVMEAAGALSIAGVKRYVETKRCRDRSFVAIASGANMNFDRLRHITERAEIGESREAILAVTIPEKPGSFKRFCSLIGKSSVTEFNYRFDDPGKAHVFVGLTIAGKDALKSTIAKFRDEGYDVVDLTDNEMAKLHARHMVGGRANVDNEHVYRFEFPERPGALLGFLNQMSSDWNISMFHYRNHGAAQARVLVGVQVPSGQMTNFKQFVKKTGYANEDESDNPVYRMFLA